MLPEIIDRHPVPNRENAALAFRGVLAAFSVPGGPPGYPNYLFVDSRAISGPAIGILVLCIDRYGNIE
jgi:hypothetical protein